MTDAVIVIRLGRGPVSGLIVAVRDSGIVVTCNGEFVFKGFEGPSSTDICFVSPAVRL
jgi:hypothetical protein